MMDAAYLLKIKLRNTKDPNLRQKAGYTFFISIDKNLHYTIHRTYITRTMPWEAKIVTIPGLLHEILTQTNIKFKGKRYTTNKIT